MNVDKESSDLLVADSWEDVDFSKISFQAEKSKDVEEKQGFEAGIVEEKRGTGLLSTPEPTLLIDNGPISRESPLDPVLVDALNKPRERLFLLRLGNDLEKMIKNPSQLQMEVPTVTSYQRLIVHRAADHYGLSHVADTEGTRVYLGKTALTRIPSLKFTHVKLQESEAEEAAVAPPVAVQTQMQGVVKIMRRSPDSRRDSPTGFGDSKAKDAPKTVEEREKDYAAARARIFATSTPPPASPSPAPDSPSGTPSPTVPPGPSKPADPRFARPKPSTQYNTPPRLQSSPRFGTPPRFQQPPQRSLYRDRSDPELNPRSAADYDRSYERYAPKYPNPPVLAYPDMPITTPAVYPDQPTHPYSLYPTYVNVSGVTEYAYALDFPPLRSVHSMSSLQAYSPLLGPPLLSPSPGPHTAFYSPAQYSIQFQ